MGFFDKVMSISESLTYVLSLRWYFSSAEGATKAQDSGDVDTELDDFFERLSADCRQIVLNLGRICGVNLITLWTVFA